MGDFHQNGVITTLHNFRNFSTEDLEARLLKFSKKRPMALVLPCLYSELDGPALPNILNELQKVNYLNEVVIGLDRANKKEFQRAREYFKCLPQDYKILWNNGPRLEYLDNLLVDMGIAPKEMGKGRNAWFCFGYLIASDKSEAIAIHDCDITTYNRSLLARLLYPVADPNFNYRYCKGYYYRASDKKLNGRVTRLLVTPLIRTLKEFFGYDKFLEYLDSFRYPLAGEFSMRADVVKTIRIPSDWGLEIGILSEVHRNNSTNRICQVDIADCYDHKHQPLSDDDKKAGLSKMSLEISSTIFTKLSQSGKVFTSGMFRSIKSAYFKNAMDMLEQYNDDAIINGLGLDRHIEEQTVDLFAQNVYNAGEMFLKNPMHSAYIPSWKRVMSAIPDFMDMFYEAVENDNK